MKIGDFVACTIEPNDWGVVLQFGTSNARILWKDGSIDWCPKKWLEKMTKEETDNMNKRPSRETWLFPVWLQVGSLLIVSSA